MLTILPAAIAAITFALGTGVAVANRAPTVPIPNSPSVAMGATTQAPAFSWQPSTDPEGEALTYDLEVEDDAGTLVASARGVVGTVTAIAPVLSNCATYRWRVRATDASGAASAFSPATTFAVSVPIDCPQVLICEDRGCAGTVCRGPCCGCGCEEPPQTEDCQASGSPGLGVLIVLAVGSLVRRLGRRRSVGREAGR